MANIKNTIVLYILFLSSIFSQTKHLNFEKYNEAEGLLGSLCISFLQDSSGFIWIGTDQGLTRFNGYEFLSFSHNAGDSTSLSDNVVRTIVQTKDSSIWIGTKSGLNKLEFSQEQNTKSDKTTFRHFFHDSSNTKSLSNNSINAIYQDNREQIWIGTHNGLNRLDLENYSKNNSPIFIHYFNNPKDSNSISHKAIKAIVGDDEGNLWIGTLGGGLNKFNIKAREFKRFFNGNKSRAGKYVLSLFIDQTGILWIGTYGGGLIKFDTNNETFIVYKNKPDDKFSISSNNIVSIQEDKNHNLWLGTLGGGINKFDLIKERFISYKNDPLNEKGLLSNLIYSMLVDRSNILWIGTNKGMNKLDLKPVKFELFRNDPKDNNSILDNYVLSIIEDHSGNLWIGNNKGVDRVDNFTKEFTHYKFFQNNSESRFSPVYKTYEDSSNNLWASTFGKGLYKFNKQNKIFEKFKLFKYSKEVTNLRIVELLENTSGSLLLGSYPGIYNLNITNGKLTEYTVCDKDSINFSKKNINVLYKDSHGNLWVGTTSGLFSFNFTSKKCKSYTNDLKIEHSAASIFIRAIYEDKNDAMWFGTENGLYRYTITSKKFTHFTTRNGLPSNYISNILEDNEGNLWISAGKWISKFDGKVFKNYGNKDGLQGLEFNTHASFKNNKGEMYFGGVNGFNKFLPNQVKDNPFKPKVALTAFKIFNKLIKSGLELTKLKKIVMPHTASFFSIEFIALDYTNPAQNKYAYTLEGFDKDWNYIGNRRFANYTNLDAGQYVFKVKASNNDVVWNEKGKSILLIIKPPFWQTWWAYLFYALVFVVGIVSLRNYELNKRRKKEEDRLRVINEKAKLKQSELRAEAAEYQAKVLESEKEIEKQQIRNRISTDLHDEIGSNLSSIILLSSLVNKKQTSENDQRKYINEIHGAAKISAEAIRDIVWLINPLSDQIGKLASRMVKTANTMLGDIKHEIVSSKFDNSEKLRPDVKRNIFLIYKEILTNIIKHSKADFIKIDIVEKNNIFEFTIADNGIGFNTTKASNGNGLRNLKYRTDQINGKLKLSSEKGKGTKITLEYNMA